MPSFAPIFGRCCFAAVFVGIGAASMRWGPTAYTAAHERFFTAGSTTGPTTSSTSRPAARGGSNSADTWVVGRGDLRITFVETGKLRAIKSYPIYPEISRMQLKITFLAPEGAMVKKDELICSFDKKAFEDQLQSRRADLEGAVRQLTVNESALAIARSTGETNVKQAINKLDDAEVAYKTYLELEGPKKLNELDKTINEARTKATESSKNVSDAQAKIDDGLFSEEEQKKALERELADAKQSQRTFEKSVSALVLQRKIFRAYEYPQSLKSKRQAVDGAKMEVEKARVQADNDVNQKQAEVARVNDTIKRVQREIENLVDMISKCDLKSPVDGLIVYGDPSSPYIRYDNQVKVGADWYGGQTLMTIPDLSSFELDINVAENYVGKVREGVPVSVTFDAVPNLKLDGKLKEIAKLGRPREMYDPSSARVFAGIISLDGSDPRLVSGMTGRVEIIADKVEGALLVPMDAVATEGGKTIVVMRLPNGKTEKRDVTVGRSNNSMVEVTEGLAEGEPVALGAASVGSTLAEATAATK